MNIDILKSFLLWSTLINYGILVLWFVVLIAARDTIYKLHSRWFRLTDEKFDGFMYLGMAIYKILVLVFNLVPFIALKIAHYE